METLWTSVDTTAASILLYSPKQNGKHSAHAANAAVCFNNVHYSKQIPGGFWSDFSLALVTVSRLPGWRSNTCALQIALSAAVLRLPCSAREVKVQESSWAVLDASLLANLEIWQTSEPEDYQASVWEDA